MKLENELYKALSNEAYHASEGISRSALMLLKKSPKHFWHKFLSGAYEEKTTDDMILGSLVHALVLEPETVEFNFAMMPEINRRTNAGKEEYKLFCLQNSHKSIVDAEMMEKANSLANAIKQNETCALLLDGSVVEQSIYFTHALTGIQCKVRPDALNGAVAMDLKTSRDASYRCFQNDAYSAGYFLQAAMIYYGLKSVDIVMEKFIFMVVEKTPPYPVAIYYLNEGAIEFGLQEFDRLMLKYQSCLETEKWEDYGIQELFIPGYAKFDNYEE